MLAIFRLLGCGGVIVLAGYFLGREQPDRMLQRGADLLSLPRWRANLRQELEFGRRLEEKSAALVVCVLIKQQLLQDLIQERLTLIETARRVQQLDRIRLHGQPNKYCLVWPGSTELERYCRQIIHAVECELSQQPSAAAAVLARLNAEFQAAAASGGFCLLR